MFVRRRFKHHVASATQLREDGPLASGRGPTVAAVQAEGHEFAGLVRTGVSARHRMSCIVRVKEWTKARGGIETCEQLMVDLQ